MSTNRKLKYVWRVVVILLLNILIIAAFMRTNNNSVQTLSKVGSTGTEVRQIQTRLKQWGYYKGSVDGIYGTATKNAVIAFQKKNGLTPDGIAGPASISSSGGNTGGAGGFSQNDVNLLAQCYLRRGPW
jgi:N-acetylmuramoyl-L-alanine amidase